MVPRDAARVGCDPAIEVDAKIAADAFSSLTQVGERIDALRSTVPNAPGLYAFHAEGHCWQELGLLHVEGRPLYVGKAERSLQSRDVRTHFERGKTGSSTVRRSFAALLRDELDLRAIPRSATNPGYFANYALEPDSDLRLTTWMRENVSLSWWVKPICGHLRSFELAAIEYFQPPLNLTDVAAPSPVLKAARAQMAAQARNSVERLG